MEFGEIKKYTREDNKITIEFENQIVIVEVINDYIINFFSPLCRKERNSKAVENIKYDNRYIRYKNPKRKLSAAIKNFKSESKRFSIDSLSSSSKKGLE